MEANNRYMPDANSQYNVDSEFMKQQCYNKNDSALYENTPYEKSTTTSQDSRTVRYKDRKNDDLGPETNVDTLDDANDSCTLVNTSRELFSNENSNNNLAVENVLDDKLLYPSSNTKQHNNISVDNVGDSDESDDEWNFYRIEPNQNTENSLRPKVSSVVTEVSEEIIEPEILENNKDLLKSDEKVNLCNQSTEESEEKINEKLLFPTTLNDCTEEMDFSLNPNAAEFVPVSSPSSIPTRFMDLPISGSPLKQTSVMDDINLPSPKEFKEEASHRPHEVEEEVNETVSLNGNAFTAENIQEFDDKKKVALNLDESEISSTRAEFGDESNIGFLGTDFQKTSGFDGSFTESCSEYENDPMLISIGPDGFNLLSNPVDLNAIHDLNDSDLCDINSLSDEKEQSGISLDVHPQPLDLKSEDPNYLQLSTTPLDHENTNNNILCTLSPVSEQLHVKDTENNTDEIKSQVAAMNLKNEQLSEVCLKNTNDFTNNTDNIKDVDKAQDNSSLSEQKLVESMFFESQHVPLENVEIQTSQHKSDSSFENCLIPCYESDKLEHHQEDNLTDQSKKNSFSSLEKLTSHDSINNQVITKSEATYNDVCEFKNEYKEKELSGERDIVLDVSVSNNFSDEKEIKDITVSPDKSMKLSKSLQEFTGLEQELSPIENNEVIIKNISDKLSEKPQVQDAITTKDVVEENFDKYVDQTTTITAELSTEKTKVPIIAAKNTTTVTTKSKPNKTTSKTVIKNSPIKSSTKVAPTALSKPSRGIVSRCTTLFTDTKKVTGVGVSVNSVDNLKVSSSNKLGSKSEIKSAGRLTSISQSKSSTAKVTLTPTIEKKSTVTTNGDSKATKIPPKSRTSTVDVTSKPLVKSSVSSARLTTTTKSKSSVGTTACKPALKTISDTNSIGFNLRPKTAPSALTVPKNRTFNSVKSSIVDKNIKETANKQISSRTISTTNTKTSCPGIHSTTTALSATTKRSTSVRTTKQPSSLNRITAKNVKTSTKTNLTKTQLLNNVDEIQDTKIVTESIAVPTTTIANIETLSEKDSTIPTIENQEIIGEEL